MNDNQQTQENRMEQAEQGEPAEPPQQSRSQTLNLVADEDAAVYEEQQTGVRFSYVLRQEEFYEAFRRENKRSPAYKKHILWLVLLGGITIVCVVFGLMLGNSGQLFRVAILSALFGLFLWISPILRMKGLSKQLATGEEINVAVYPDEIEVEVGDNHWTLPLNNTAKMDMTPQLILLHKNENRGLVIPQRSIEPAIRADVLAILMAGTQKYE